MAIKNTHDVISLLRLHVEALCGKVHEISAYTRHCTSAAAMGTDESAKAFCAMHLVGAAVHLHADSGADAGTMLLPVPPLGTVAGADSEVDSSDDSDSSACADTGDDLDSRPDCDADPVFVGQMIVSDFEYKLPEALSIVLFPRDRAPRAG